MRDCGEGDVEKARKAVSMIVGRDTAVLDEAGITRAAVETVAENTSDGVIAPLFYFLCFGIYGGIFYKAVNTMDSMIGYRNDKYRYFGTAAARLDDVCNFLPARISALFMILAAFCLGLDGKMRRKSGNGTDTGMPALIPPRRRVSAPGHWISVWQGMPGILENYIKSLTSGRISARWSRRTSDGQTDYCI